LVRHVLVYGSLCFYEIQQDGERVRQGSILRTAKILNSLAYVLLFCVIIFTSYILKMYLLSKMVDRSDVFMA